MYGNLIKVNRIPQLIDLSVRRNRFAPIWEIYNAGIAKLIPISQFMVTTLKAIKYIRISFPQLDDVVFCIRSGWCRHSVMIDPPK